MSDPDSEEKKDDRALASMDMVLGSPNQVESMNTSLWLGDTGASNHMTNNSDGMVNQVEINTGIVFGNGQRLKAVFIGDKRGMVVQNDDTRIPILSQNADYVHQLYCNLFSITAAFNEGCKSDVFILKENKQ